MSASLDDLLEGGPAYGVLDAKDGVVLFRRPGFERAFEAVATEAVKLAGDEFEVIPLTQGEDCDRLFIAPLHEARSFDPTDRGRMNRRSDRALAARDDPHSCRRALRDIGEIAAVAMLEGSQLSDQEALQMIAAIAEWSDEDGATDRADCRDRIHRLHAMTAALDFATLGDAEAVRLFGAVRRTLEDQAASG